MTVLVIDPFEFSRRQESREGSLPISGLTRLTQEVADTAGVLTWQVQGQADVSETPRLILCVTGQLQLACQRCLMPMAFTLDTRSTLVLAKDDAEADHLEEVLEDQDVDVVIATPSMDLVELIEDDVLLALPYSQRHATCPVHPDAVQMKNERPDSPFKVLKNLKGESDKSK